MTVKTIKASFKLKILFLRFCPMEEFQLEDDDQSRLFPFVSMKS